MKCSHCDNEARPNQRYCLPCHATASREARTRHRSELAQLIEMVSELREELRSGRKGPHRTEPRTTSEQRRRA